MQQTEQEAAMAESMVGIVVGLIVLVGSVVLVSTHHRREPPGRHGLPRHDGHRLWERMRHRH
jgi:hypothetical protein